MTDRPITPPPVNLLHQWMDEAENEKRSVAHYVARKSAQWGADQELEACCAVVRTVYGKLMADWLRSMRRPKPPSLKEQALIHFESYAASFETSGGDSDLIRRALEALPDE
jgi:hypothetical protein